MMIMLIQKALGGFVTWGPPLWLPLTQNSNGVTTPQSEEEMFLLFMILLVIAVVLFSWLMIRAHDRAWAKLTPDERKKLLENQRHYVGRYPWM